MPRLRCWWWHANVAYPPCPVCVGDDYDPAVYCHGRNEREAVHLIEDTKREMKARGYARPGNFWSVLKKVDAVPRIEAPAYAHRDNFSIGGIVRGLWHPKVLVRIASLRNGSGPIDLRWREAVLAVVASANGAEMDAAWTSYEFGGARGLAIYVDSIIPERRRLGPALECLPGSSSDADKAATYIL